MTGFVAHGYELRETRSDRWDTRPILLISDKFLNLGVEELLWVGQILPKQCLANTGLVVILGVINIRSCESTH